VYQFNWNKLTRKSVHLVGHSLVQVGVLCGINSFSYESFPTINYGEVLRHFPPPDKHMATVKQFTLQETVAK